MKFVRCRLVLPGLVWLLTTAPVSAQFVASPGPAAPYNNRTVTSAPVAGFIPPAPAAVAPGYGYPGYIAPYYDPYGGYFRGVSSLVSSYGQYYQDIGQARLTNQSVEQEKLKTRQMIIDQHRYEQSLIPTVEEMRTQKQQRDLARAMNNPPLTEILSGDALNTLLQQSQKLEMMGGRGPTVPLDSQTLSKIQVSGSTGGNVGAFKGGKLKWPFALRDTPYDQDRERFEQLYQEALKDVSNLRPATVKEMRSVLDHMEATEKRNAPTMDLNDIMEIRRYLDQLRDGVTALTSPNAENYFNSKWTARGNDVRELVYNMTREGLRFAAAVRGDEAAYRILHQAMVSYNYGAAQARR
jgi:hypothetical protein